MRIFPFPSVLAIDQQQRLFLHEERMIAALDDYFWKAFDYLRANQIKGDYLEFGCGCSVKSFRLASKYRTILYRSPQLFAFDSFAGLPEIRDGDEHPGWSKGSMAVSENEFRQIMSLHGLVVDDYKLIPGFFETTLDGRRPKDYGIDQAAFVYIDCDLYASATKALEFVGDALTHGSILAFDDWNCYCADPRKGEQRAFSEFQLSHPKLRFVEFLSFGWHGKSFIVHSEDRVM